MPFLLVVNKLLPTKVLDRVYLKSNISQLAIPVIYSTSMLNFVCIEMMLPVIKLVIV